MRTLVSSLAAGVLLFAAAVSAAAQAGPRAQRVATAARAADAITIVTDGGLSVRLHGLSAFPRRAGDGARDDGRDFLETLVAGKKVLVERVPQRRAAPGPVPAYVFLADDGTFVNGEVVRNGFAVAVAKPDQARAEELLALQESARAGGMGFWAAAGAPAEGRAAAEEPYAPTFSNIDIPSRSGSAAGPAPSARAAARPAGPRPAPTRAASGGRVGTQVSTTNRVRETLGAPGRPR